MTDLMARTAQAASLTSLLGLSQPPLAILFSFEAPAGVPRFDLKDYVVLMSDTRCPRNPQQRSPH